jgi:hypothetical protein
MGSDEDEACQDSQRLELRLTQKGKHFEQVNVSDPEPCDGSEASKTARPSVSCLLLGRRQRVDQQSSVRRHDWDVQVIANRGRQLPRRTWSVSTHSKRLTGVDREIDQEHRRHSEDDAGCRMLPATTDSAQHYRLNVPPDESRTHWTAWTEEERGDVLCATEHDGRKDGEDATSDDEWPPTSEARFGATERMRQGGQTLRKWKYDVICKSSCTYSAMIPVDVGCK